MNMYYNQFNGAQSHVLYYTSYKSVEILRTFRVNAHMTNVAAFLLVNPKLVQIRIKKTPKHWRWAQLWEKQPWLQRDILCQKSEAEFWYKVRQLIVGLKSKTSP